MSRFTTLLEPLAGLQLLQRKTLGDARGHFSRLFDAEEMTEFGWHGGIFQINETLTAQAGTVRGMHFQFPPFAEIKLVSCLQGRVLDIAVDIRKDSPSFLQHYAVELDGESGLSLLIGEGFAHGFQTLTDNVRMIYAHSAPYRAHSEGGLNPLDPRLKINWPDPVENLSARDLGHAYLDEDYCGVAL